MKFQFYGDSWYWCWNFSTMRLKSNAITDGLYRAPYPHIKDCKSDCISFIEILLNRLGHESQHVCIPGQAFSETVARIISSSYESVHNLGVNGIPFDSTIDHHIVFYSGQMRGEELKRYLVTNRHLSYTKFEKQYYQETIDDLILLGEFANRVNKKYIIVGGQSTLFRRVFDQVPSHLRENLVLLSECMLESIQCKHTGLQPQPTGPFKLTDVTGSEMEVPWDIINPNIVDNIYSHISDFKMRYQHLTWPDGAHLGAGATVVFLDILFAHLEGK